ncbi:auxin efflux carrier component 1b-related [Anaeramoeba ignava]|uniref:Auxin efflux carrier component 1b-related n=1 Tax=Anaeramoeba ignava TaxID=1746090 RepID=A0A9Q0L6Y9_ANAIG|nr:auxin efflux carrier component 1b-related [Anaeramoeba ignava]
MSNNSAYLQVTYQSLALLIFFISGWLAAFTKIIQPEQTLRNMNVFVLKICLPAILFRAFINIPSEKMDWNFALMYIVANIIAALICFVYVFFKKLKKQQGIYALIYIIFAWPNQIIFGIPILRSIFDESYDIYPVMSTFFNIFRFPFVFFLMEKLQIKREIEKEKLEKEKLEKEKLEQIKKIKIEKSEETDFQEITELTEITDIMENQDENQNQNQNQNQDKNQNENENSNQNQNQNENSNQNQNENLIDDASWIQLQFSSSSIDDDSRTPIKNKKSFKKTLFKSLVTNLPLWSNFLGLAYSFLKLPVPTALSMIVDPLSASLVPAALFCVGIFVYIRKRIISSGWKSMIIWLFLRHFAFPILVVLVCIPFNIRGKILQSAVIVSEMPLAVAAFTIGQEYNLGREAISTTIIVGTLMTGPFTLFWIFVMNNISFFK